MDPALDKIVKNNKIIIMYTTFEEHVISCSSIYPFYLNCISAYPTINFFVHNVDRSDNDIITLIDPTSKEEKEPEITCLPTFVTANKGVLVNTIIGRQEDNCLVSEERLTNLLDKLNNS
jgi:hypothetical protein